MRATFIPLSLLMLSSCSASGPWPRTPNPRIVDTLEAKLTKVGCVGRISRWERHYSFASKPSILVELLTLGAGDRWFDYDSLKISYYKAGFEEFRSRRVLHRGEEPLGIDDREFDLVFGDYDIPSRTAVLWACGPNMDGAPTQNIVIR